ncbi:PIN domain-containing protein [Glaesserella parasuis]|uniref:PIN domain-containing protein n=1 Tax=Glaesserella parasuis TaxID=738 RepID=UPI0003ABDEBF|nr:PIN domain-containing protein [Glaesserella parasuis]EQA15136.1 hypothetical protein HPSH465_1580 [Glaesserella parasuis H465]MCT8524794.1 DUF4935 domain-containing protein [Glaesserella parasuis]MCT8527838.1 DUF4935 domain-containing protein [Glaesserella parasuis]MCT8529117.1 DUF4935 domain-containing protein [Glaesserella parasuis]MCT8537562.1 DUF4935 domain-containing protein [Glaesserella parasuis]
MPNSLPSIEDVIAGKIKFFSLDTSVIKGAGYKFFDDKLLDLYLQLPYQVRLICPEVVYKEILSHKKEEVVNDIKKLKSATDNLIRKEVLNNDALNIDFHLLEDRFLNKKINEIDTYVKQFDGKILSIDNCNISEIFNRYFDCKPPFENNKEKKNEFPDAVCLDLIEQYSLDNNEIGIIISDDKGWGEFAKESKNLYYSESIDEFTKLFVARNDEIADIIRSKIYAVIQDEDSFLFSEVKEQLNIVQWIPDIFSENLYSCESDVLSYECKKLTISEDIDVWKSERESATWVVKLDISFDLNLEIEVEHYIKDPVDKDLVSMGIETINIEVHPEFQFHIICSNINIESDCNIWDMEVKLLNEIYYLEPIGVYYSFE